MIDALIVYFSTLRGWVKGLPFDTIIELAGLALIAYGVAMIFVPAGIITLGAGLCFIGYALGENPRPTTARREVDE